MDKPTKKKKKTKVVAKKSFTKKKEKPKANKKGYQLEYERGIALNRDRNKEIARIVNRHTNDSVIVLVQQVEHGLHVLNKIPNAKMITGAESKEDRRLLLTAFRKGEIKCLVGTSVLGEGVDLPIANVLVLAGGGKSKIQYMQNLGRVMRLFPGKTKALVYDFLDEGTEYLSEHAKERAKIYAEIY